MELVEPWRSKSILVKLSAMMFLQYAIWGAWLPVLWVYLEEHFKFGGKQLGWLYNVIPIATLLSPFTAGQVADRWLPTQVALGIFHLIGAAVLVGAALQHTFLPMFALMLLWALFYAPTLALTNSIAFHHLKDPGRQFGYIRVWGTIGWIAAGWLLLLPRNYMNSLEWQVVDTIMLAAVFSGIMGILCFFLPHTPPARQVRNPWAFLEALKLLKIRSYLIFFIIAFIVATELQLYYGLSSPYLKAIGVPEEHISGYLTIAQVAEIFVMALLLPLVLPTWGIRKSLLLGIVAWPIRYIIFAAAFAAQLPVWVSAAALTLHGFCYVFFFTVAFIYTDSVATADIRASAQALISFAVLGVGLIIGGWFTGWLKDYFTYRQATDYCSIFLIPATITILCAIAFWLLFKGEAAATTQKSN